MAKATARHILVDSEDKCADLKQQIADGADFADMARTHSSCPSGRQGGDLGEFGPGMMVPEFDKVVFSGDLGYRDAPLMDPTTRLNHADVVLMESTYGDRDHLPIDETLAEISEVFEAAQCLLALINRQDDDADSEFSGIRQVGDAKVPRLVHPLRPPLLSVCESDGGRSVLFSPATIPGTNCRK